VSGGVSAGIAGECARGRMRVRGPCAAILPVKPGRQGTDPAHDSRLVTRTALTMANMPEVVTQARQRSRGSSRRGVVRLVDTTMRGN
jgi:hypothetical protein